MRDMRDDGQQNATPASDVIFAFTHDDGDFILLYFLGVTTFLLAILIITQRAYELDALLARHTRIIGRRRHAAFSPHILG